MKKIKRHRRAELPYTPSPEFIAESIKLLREKGVKDSDENITPMVLRAYRAKRAEILAKEVMELHENA